MSLEREIQIYNKLASERFNYTTFENIIISTYSLELCNVLSSDNLYDFHLYTERLASPNHYVSDLFTTSKLHKLSLEVSNLQVPHHKHYSIIGLPELSIIINHFGVPDEQISTVTQQMVENVGYTQYTENNKHYLIIPYNKYEKWIREHNGFEKDIDVLLLHQLVQENISNEQIIQYLTSQ